jgi:hypothetical protein
MLRNRTLFISYRRDDSSGWAGRLEADLRSRLGTDVQVFMDVDAIPAGEDFARAIDDAVSRSDALVALIGPGWVTAQDAHGRRRLDNPNDLVRIEIETALRRGIRVIPTLVGGASLPSPDVLPETLRDLPKRQAVRLDHETWSLGLNRLVRALERRSVFGWAKDLGALAAAIGTVFGLLRLSERGWFAAVSVAYLSVWSYGVLLRWLKDKTKTSIVLAAALVLTVVAAVPGYKPPRPSGKITSPKPGAKVPADIRTVVGESANVPPDESIWVFHKAPDDKYYAPAGPAEMKNGGSWTVDVDLRKTGTGRFELVAISAGQVLTESLRIDRRQPNSDKKKYWGMTALNGPDGLRCGYSELAKTYLVRN